MWERNSTKILGALAALGLLAASFLFGFGVGRQSPLPSATDYGMLAEVERHINESSVKTVDRNKLIQGAIRGMLQALEDPYAEYLDPAGYEAFQEVSSGHFFGIGLWMKDEEGQHRVVSVIQDSPAARAGIEPGDTILRINGGSVEGLTLEQVVQRVKGEAGTGVRLSLQRGDQRLDVTLVRERINVTTVDAKMLRNSVGSIQILTFTEGVGAKVREAVMNLSEDGAKGFILDLRGNPGGLLKEAVEVSSVFLDGGAVVSFKERGRPEVVYQTRGAVGTSLPVVVLVDEGSASSSEIVAGAMQDRGRGIIVGTRTYGKGSIQTVFPLEDGSALRITTASYFTPSGRAIGDQPIEPDVAVAEQANQLARAQEILREIVADVAAAQAS